MNLDGLDNVVGFSQAYALSVLLLLVAIVRRSALICYVLAVKNNTKAVNMVANEITGIEDEPEIPLRGNGCVWKGGRKGGSGIPRSYSIP